MFKKIKAFYRHILDFFNTEDPVVIQNKQRQEFLKQLYMQRFNNKKTFAEVSLLVDLDDKAGVTNIALILPGQKQSGDVMSVMCSLGSPSPMQPPKFVNLQGIHHLLSAGEHFHKEASKKNPVTLTTLRISCMVPRNVSVSDHVFVATNRIHRHCAAPIVNETTYGEIYLRGDQDNKHSPIPILDIGDLK